MALHEVGTCAAATTGAELEGEDEVDAAPVFEPGVPLLDGAVVLDEPHAATRVRHAKAAAAVAVRR
jgi:hypothetical protein